MRPQAIAILITSLIMLPGVVGAQTENDARENLRAYAEPGIVVRHYDEIPRVPGMDFNRTRGEIEGILELFSEVRVVYFEGRGGRGGTVCTSRSLNSRRGSMWGWEIAIDTRTCDSIQLVAFQPDPTHPAEFLGLIYFGVAFYVMVEHVGAQTVTMARYLAPWHDFTGRSSFYAPTTTSYWETLMLYSTHGSPFFDLQIATHPRD